MKLLLLFIVCTTNIFAQSNVFHLLSMQKNSDVDPEFVKNIDSVPVPWPAKGNFQIGDLKTVSGKYTIYRFIHNYQSENHDSGKLQRFHDLLFVVASDKTVVKAFYYTLEWQDSPSVALYSSGCNGQVLNKNPVVEDFCFKNSYAQLLNKKGQVSLQINKKAIEENRSVHDFPGKIVLLDINQEELTLSGAYVVYAPDSNRKQAEYKKYYFAKKDMELLQKKQKSVPCIVTKNETVINQDKKGSVPQGGIRIEKIWCDIYQ